MNSRTKETSLRALIRLMQEEEMTDIQLTSHTEGLLGRFYYDLTSDTFYTNPALTMDLGLAEGSLSSLDTLLSYVDPMDRDPLKRLFQDPNERLSGHFEHLVPFNVEVAYPKYYLLRGQDQISLGHHFLVGTCLDMTSKHVHKKSPKDYTVPPHLKDALDPLTGLLTKDLIAKQTEKSITCAMTGLEPFCLLLCDLDFFKNINDHFGRRKGDEVLIEVAKILKKETRHTDYIGRIGGDQFLLLLSGVDFKTGQLIAERIRKAIANHMFIGGIRVTLSGGLVSYEKGSSETLLRAAGDLMLYSKKNGHNKMTY